MEIKIPKEVRQHSETIFFGLSTRQFICAVLAVGVAIGAYFLTKGAIGKETASWVCIVAAAPLAAAPAAVVVMGDRAASDLWVDNAAISATILQLTLVDAGLKSCWVHVNGRPRRKEQPDGEQAADYLRSFLPIPEGYGVLCVIALGYSDFEPKPLPAGDPVERVQWVE